ncbi:MAG: elongation factor 1-beta [Nanoarchaeota archaeon]
MGIALIKIKLMPTSPEIDLEELKADITKIIEKNKGKRIRFEEQPIAFGLKAIIAGFEQDETEGKLDPIESALNNLENVSSVQIIDMRRAFG